MTTRGNTDPIPGRDYPETLDLWVTCPCGKRGYLTRKLARRVVTEIRADSRRRHDLLLRAYRCDRASQLWHVGNIAPGPNLNDPRLRHLPN